MANLLGFVMLVAVQGVGVAPADRPAGPVVFVCEHGSVKSMMAALWFNRLASERGLRRQAVSRGVAPEAAIPEGVAQGLKTDGFDLKGVVPAGLQAADLSQAVHVVAIGARSPLFDALATLPERWDDIPPASVDYRASRDAIRRRLSILVDALIREEDVGRAGER